MTAFNVRCIDELDNIKLDNITLSDGQNHPLDKKVGK